MIYSYGASGNKKMKSEILTNFCVVQGNKKMYIEFKYQNSWYSYDSMGQVHLLFLDFQFYGGFDRKN